MARPVPAAPRLQRAGPAHPLAGRRQRRVGQRALPLRRPHRGSSSPPCCSGSRCAGPFPELRISPPAQMIYLFVTSIVPTVPGAWLTFAEGAVYSAYDIPDRLWGISVTSDQQVAGLLMKLVGGTYLWVLITVIFFRWAAKRARAAIVEPRPGPHVGRGRSRSSRNTPPPRPSARHWGHGGRRVRGDDRALPLGLARPWWPPEPRAAGRRAQRAARRARRRRLRPARLLRLRHRHPDPRPPGRRRAALLELPHHRAVLADPGLRAHRPQPPRRRHGPHRRPGHRLPRLRRPHPALVRAAARPCSRRTATPPTRSASGTSPPRTRSTSAPAATAGRSAGASSASTASSPARPTSTCPPWSTTTTASSRPAACEDGYHLTEDLVDHAIEYLEDLRNVDVDKPWLLYLATGRLPLAPPGAAGRGSSATAGRFDGGWDAWRDAALARQKAAGLLPDAHRAVAPARLGAGVGRRSPPTSGACTPATWRPSPASCPTPTHELGRLRRPTRRPGRARRHGDRGAVRQRRLVGGRPGRLAQRRPRRGTCCPRTVEEAAERLDEIGGPRIHNNYPWGWTVAGNTPFRRWKRETHEGGVADPLIVHWPAGIAGSRRGAAASTCTPSTSPPRVLEADRPRAAGRGRTASPSGRSTAPASPTPSPTPAAPERARRPALRDVRLPGALPTTAGRPSPTRRSRPTTPALDEQRWELYDLRADPSECHDLAAAEPERLAGHDRALVGGGRAAPGAAPRQPAVLGARVRAGPVGGRPGLGTRTGPAGRRCPRAWPSTSAGGPTRSPPTSPSIRAVEVVEGVLAVQGSVLGGWSFHLLGDGRLCYVHNLAGWRPYRVEAEIAPAGSRRPLARLPVRRGPARRCSSTAGSSATGAVDRTAWSRFSLTGAGLTAGWAPDLSPADEDYRGRFAFTGTLHRVDIDVAGDPRVDAVQEAQDALSAQ